MKRLLAVAMLVAALLSVTGCSSEKGDWEAAEVAGTLAAYRECLSRHPDGEYADDARAAALELEEVEDWETALAGGDTALWRSYMEKWSESPRIRDAAAELATLQELIEARQTIALSALQWFAYVPHPLLDGVAVADTQLLRRSAMWGESISNIISTITMDGAVPGAVFYGQSSGPSMFSTKNVSLAALADGIGCEFSGEWDTPYIAMSDGLPMVEFRVGQVVLRSGHVAFSDGLEARIWSGASGDTSKRYYVFADGWHPRVASSREGSGGPAN